MSELVRVIVVALISSGALWSVALFYLNRREKIRERAEERREDERIEARKRDETWFREADQAYKRVELECTKCTQTLGSLRRRFHTLLWALDDMCDQAGNGDVKVAELRAAVRIARKLPDDV
jgi:hypothetical protein